MIDRRGDAQALGRRAEELAREHLQSHGLRLLAQNWRCRRGELDLVMLDGDTVVFVEVRCRRNPAFGGALESVDARKRQRLVAAAEHFLQQEARWSRHPCRFDVVAVQPTAGTPAQPNWITNAFDT
ncbi:YraN family protein [Pseudomonas citronellolis]|uniref:YraN family protein n=1 Tax=Pseudomonas citronellolis TaxID=53408 RepID=UPI0023E37ECC|nr:YraN family protein [Pseudomonas citronellolis]MDF3934380.1 YraN family protein [Pseudomonas citronellolis]